MARFYLQFLDCLEDNCWYLDALDTSDNKNTAVWNLIFRVNNHIKY